MLNVKKETELYMDVSKHRQYNEVLLLTQKGLIPHLYLAPRVPPSQGGRNERVTVFELLFDFDGRVEGLIKLKH